ncbi:MAG: hypothetical protein SGJ10_00380 [Bacteroidota bacterium]|nr:hypothetical protein [Bacteroidota bacterium]
MLNKLLFFDRGKLQLSIVIGGTLLGLILLLLPLQLFLDFRELLTQKTDLLNPQYMVLNKEVTLMGMVGDKKQGFSQNEIEKLKKQQSVEEIAPFTANNFYSFGILGFGGGVPDFQTDLFLEAVPTKFLDNLPHNWQWEPGKDIPIILPTDFINLYNFSFAATHGLPQVSKTVVKMAPFKIVVDSMGKKVEFNAHISGFSDRINTIIVPLQFLEYGNKSFTKADGLETKPGKIIVKSNDPTNASLSNYIAHCGYETNQELLRNAKLTGVLRVVASVLSILGLLIVVLSATGFFQFAQLVLNRKAYEVKTLLQLGFNPKTIWKYYFKIFTMILSSVLVFSCIIIYIFKPWFAEFAANYGFELNAGVSSITIFSGIVVVCIYLFSTMANLWREILRS